MLGHEVYPILSLHRPQPGSSITVVVGPGAALGQMGCKEARGRHPSRTDFHLPALKSPDQLGEFSDARAPQRLGSALTALLAALSFVRGIYSDSVIRRRLD